MTYAIYHKSPSPMGTDVFRLTGVDVPALYKPTISHTTKANASLSNVNVTVKSRYPVALDKDGVWSAPNSFVMTTTFSALQNIQNDTERARTFDEHVAFLAANRLDIINGTRDEVYA